MMKIILISVLFVVNIFGLFAILSNYINTPFKVFFGYKNKRTGKKKVYWFGHVILALAIFYFWKELTFSEPSLVLVLALTISTALSMVISKRTRNFLGNSSLVYVDDSTKTAFILNTLLVYILGLLFYEIAFAIW